MKHNYRVKAVEKKLNERIPREVFVLFRYPGTFGYRGKEYPAADYDAFCKARQTEGVTVHAVRFD